MVMREMEVGYQISDIRYQRSEVRVDWKPELRSQKGEAGDGKREACRGTFGKKGERGRGQTLHFALAISANVQKGAKEGVEVDMCCQVEASVPA
jgi:hypothetical protein